jgi:carbonic anhydrase
MADYVVTNSKRGAAPDGLEDLFANNRAWARRMHETDADFFNRLAQQQAPRYLWIGCSDSRVPANQIIGLPPGEVFVHRNVANLVVPTDLNCLTVVEYAVDVLKVEHIMVVGHYGCGGVQTVLSGQRLGLAGHWLHHVEMVRHTHAEKLDAIEDREQLVNRLCELNALEQVSQLCRLPSVMHAWKREQPLTLHCLIYDIHDGLLRRLAASVASPPDLAKWRRAALKSLWAGPAVRTPR